MNGFVILSFSTVACFLCHILDEAFCDTTSSFYRHPNKTLTYAVFKNHSFLDLDVPIVEEALVETERKCLLRCVKNYQCLSANTGAFRRQDGNFLCVLLSTDKYSAPKKFRANYSFHHYSIVVSVFCFLSCFFFLINSFTRRYYHSWQSLRPIKPGFNHSWLRVFEQFFKIGERFGWFCLCLCLHRPSFSLDCLCLCLPLMFASLVKAILRTF